MSITISIFFPPSNFAIPSRNLFSAEPDTIAGASSICEIGTRNTSVTLSTINPVTRPSNFATIIRVASFFSAVPIEKRVLISITGNTLPRRLIIPSTKPGACGTSVMFEHLIIS